MLPKKARECYLFEQEIHTWVEHVEAEQPSARVLPPGADRVDNANEVAK
jgi:hypothetical protein